MVHIIIVLGCGNVLGEPEKKRGEKIFERSHVYSRLMKAYEVYLEIKEEKIVVCTGWYGEAQMMKEFLIEKGIPEQQIFEEPESRNTIENCIFSYNILYRWFRSECCVEMLNGSVQNTTKLDRSGIVKLNPVDMTTIQIHLVTNDYHIERSNKIFNFFLPLLGEKNISISKYGASILSFIPNYTENDIREVEALIEKDFNIATNFLPNSLRHYSSLYLI